MLFKIPYPITDRKKFGDYAKKLEKLETLVLEFELCDDEKLQPFFKELEEKLHAMSSFKKLFLKEVMAGENLCKLPAFLTEA